MNLINKLLNKGLSVEDAKIFNYLTVFIQQGRATTQIPLIEINFDQSIKKIDEIDIKKLFEEDIVFWHTNKGIIRNEECRNPDTNRIMSGYLFISDKFLENNLDLMYEIFSEYNKGETTVLNKKDFLALIVTKVLHCKSPKGKESLRNLYLKVCENLYPGEDIINDRLKNRCGINKKVKIK